VAVEAAKRCGDETRVFANLVTQAGIMQQLGDIDNAIAIYQQIINYPTFSGLHERAAAHLSIAPMLVLKKRMAEACAITG
jgi:hypothetical protein